MPLNFLIFFLFYAFVSLPSLLLSLPGYKLLSVFCSLIKLIDGSFLILLGWGIQKDMVHCLKDTCSLFYIINILYLLFTLRNVRKLYRV